jgi:hypothetical protein
VEYLKEGTKEGEPFLLMHEFGPFDTTKMEHIKKLGEIILAFTLQMSGLHGECLDQENSGAESSPMGATEASMQQSTHQPFTQDTRTHPQVPLPGQSRAGTRSTSSDPQALVSPLSALTVSGAPRSITAQQSQRSSQPPDSIRGRLRPKPSRSTDNHPEHLAIPQRP